MILETVGHVSLGYFTSTPPEGNSHHLPPYLFPVGSLYKRQGHNHKMWSLVDCALCSAWILDQPFLICFICLSSLVCSKCCILVSGLFIGLYGCFHAWLFWSICLVCFSLGLFCLDEHEHGNFAWICTKTTWKRTVG